MGHGRDLQALNCTNCGASFSPAEVAAHAGPMTCRYCGQAFEPPLSALAVQAAPTPPPAPQRVVVIAPGAAGPAVRRGGAVAGSIFSVVAFVFIVGVGAFVSIMKSTAKITTSDLSVPGVNIKLPTIPSSFMWDTVGGPPMPAAVGGAIEGFVGRIRERGGDELWMAAFEGSKLAQVWKVGPFGSYTQGYQSTFAGIAGRHVVVTDYKANVHVYDLATGKETHTLKLSDRASAMCIAPDGKPHAWIGVSDKRDVLVDAEAGTSSPAARPAWCPDLWAASDDCRGWLKRGAARHTCRGPDMAPKVSGFQPANVVEQGDLAVALGKKHPGTAVPMAVGFDPHSKTVRWEQALPSGDQSNAAESSTISIMDDLEGGRFVAPYEITSKGWHFTAFDARSGQRLWDTALQPLIGVDNPEGFSLSADRVYVMRTSSLEVYDAKTGALVGTVGAD
jgi:hypothetical protein